MRLSASTLTTSRRSRYLRGQLLAWHHGAMHGFHSLLVGVAFSAACAEVAPATSGRPPSVPQPGGAQPMPGPPVRSSADRMPLSRQQLMHEWALAAEPENKVGADALLRGTWTWTQVFSSEGVEFARIGYDSTHLRIFGDIRLYLAIEVHHYLGVDQWARVSTRLVDCRRKVIDYWPERLVVDVEAVTDPTGRTALGAQIAAVCSASPLVETRPVGQ